MSNTLQAFATELAVKIRSKCYEVFEDELKRANLSNKVLLDVWPNIHPIVDEMIAAFPTQEWSSPEWKLPDPVAYITYKGYLLHALDPKVKEHSSSEPLYGRPLLPQDVLMQLGEEVQAAEAKLWSYYSSPRACLDDIPPNYDLKEIVAKYSKVEEKEEKPAQIADYDVTFVLRELVDIVQGMIDDGEAPSNIDSFTLQPARMILGEIDEQVKNQTGAQDIAVGDTVMFVSDEKMEPWAYAHGMKVGHKYVVTGVRRVINRFGERLDLGFFDEDPMWSSSRFTVVERVKHVLVDLTKPMTTKAGYPVKRIAGDVILIDKALCSLDVHTGKVVGGPYNGTTIVNVKDGGCGCGL